MKKIALFGYSSHAYVVADAIRLNGDELIGYYEKEKAHADPYGITYLGYEQDKDALTPLKANGISGFVGVGENNIRKKIMHFLKSQGVTCTPVIHPSAMVSGMATVGAGTLVAAGAKVNPLASVGAGVILNTGCIVEHECSIGDFAHIAPGAVLAGNVTVGEDAFIGANAVVKQGVSIGRNVVVGAGAVVLKDIPDNQTWVGNPAKEIRK
ncbi:N-acetylneuraminate synthase [Pontibacter diazotrophicus]|uniref:N-acetylneuraminate synthase n=1 Tax=Pontibacter diazotrophicus TaxID=1400979 RepID=A0A3D8LFD2_9BACT|nr:acetyltransferase [Pontibacter diazotrophicus]RDV16120.1 N-acetylneuraminate synthase [Pontibacter diazotrophicus]